MTAEIPIITTVPMSPAEQEWSAPEHYVGGYVPAAPEFRKDASKVEQVAEVAAGAALQGVGLTPPEAVASTPEQSYEARLQRIFAPVETSTEPSPTAETADNESPKYDFLLEADERKFQAGAQEFQKNQDQQKKPENPWPVTEMTRADAINQLIATAKHDQTLNQLIREQAGKVDLLDPGTVVDALRTDIDFRLNVGKYFLDRAKQAAQMPGYLPPRAERSVRLGHRKNPRRGYEANLTSPEYIALLCLAKLDGTFDKSAVHESDYASTNAQGEQTEGVHRTAAEMLL